MLERYGFELVLLFVISVVRLFIFKVGYLNNLSLVLLFVE